MRQRTFIFLRFFSLFFIILCLILSSFYIQYVYLSTIQQEDGIIYIMPKGMDTKELAFNLAQKNIISNPRFFILMARLNRAEKELRSGEYRFPKNATASDVLHKIMRGEVEKHYFMIIEGWTVKDILRALAADPRITHTVDPNTNAKTLATILKIPYPTAEGWLFPDNYQFIWGNTDKQILRHAYKCMKKILDTQWSQRAPNLRYTNQYQALIVASMVAKEAQLKIEEPMIAGVILRRLKKKMSLGIDATIIYGMGDNYQGKITRKDLRTKTPYNTYLNYGLPPSPIAMPGESSIYAALHPDNSEYLYFVARGDGSHKFSRTLKEQTEAIHEYILGTK